MVCDPRHVKPEEGGAGAYSRVGSNFFPDDFEDRRSRMRRMPAPVLVLQGQCDFLDYGDAYEYAALFPAGAYRFVPGAGHILWWDRPDDYATTIRGFLSAPDATRPAGSRSASISAQ
jgi:proline iminopeptidase